MKAHWFMSAREITLYRMTRILFLTVGSSCAALALIVWPVNPILAVVGAALIYFVGIFLWERFARRIIGHRLLSFEHAWPREKK